MTQLFEVEKDVDSCEAVLSGYPTANYDMIYTETNEYLNTLFNNIDVKDKDVLTVLASSDQLFNLLLRDTKSIDTYDINKLTKYFYYLRRWNIIYNHEYHFPYKITGKVIYELIKKVIPENEKEKKALYFWYRFINTYPPFLYDKLFIVGIRELDNQNLDKLTEKLLSYDINFKCLDISQKIKIDKKYDTIITSNISEYFTQDKELIMQYKDNLLNLLNPNGEVVSSHIMDKYVSYLEETIFSNDFELKEFPFYKKKEYYPVGYSYKKVSTKNS